LIFLLLERLFRAQNLDSLKALALEKAGFDEEEFKALLVYAAAFYSNMGNYKGFGDNKFIPGVAKDKLEKLLRLSKAWEAEPAALEHLWSEVSDPLYSLRDSEKHLGFPPKATTTYFSKNCTEKDAELASSYMKQKRPAAGAGDQDHYEIRFASVLSTEDPESSKFLVCDVMDNSKVTFTRGDYSPLLKLTVDNLRLAQENAANDTQRQMLGKYIESFTVGSLDAHKDGSRFWIRDKGPNVESYIGFIETYRDPAGIRGEFEGFVAMVNRPQSEKFGALVERAESLLKLLPWPKSFEKDRFLRPDFTSLDVLTFGGSGIPAGINIPNYDEIRQNEGFKNVSLGNVINADDKSSKANFMTANDNELFNRLKNQAFEVQVGLHELLGHGSGKLLVQRKDGTFNFDHEHVKMPHVGLGADPEAKVTSWYKEGETYDSVFGALGSSYEECRAECVGLYLCTVEDVLKLFGFEVEGMQTYNPHTKSWLQAHSRARFVIMRVLLEAGDLVEIRETTGEDGKPDLLITVDRTKILSFGRPCIEQFLLKLQLFKSTADLRAATEMYDRYSEVSDIGRYPFPQFSTVTKWSSGSTSQLQRVTCSRGSSVFDASTAKELDRVVLDLWKKDKDHF
ncbi:hypothetical protein MTO96_039580, partial [Rhipicephalus appendiculatus]